MSETLIKNKHSIVLEKAKKNHFEFLKKNNAITDAKNGELSLGAMKSLDIILKRYQETQETKMVLELSYLRKKLGLEKNNDYVERIKLYVSELKLPFELRDFKDNTGKRVEWALTSFLGDVKAYKDTHHLIEINISESFLEYMVEKAGYTKIDLSLSKQFKTKYGYKIHEMYLRYYSMPNRVDNKLGIIKKTLSELNDKFGTKHKHPSKLIEGMERGLIEIDRLTGEEISCFYDRVEKLFVFAWSKSIEGINHKCKIPHERLEEFVEWVVSHSNQQINDIDKYKGKIKKLILENTLDELEASYRGMLIYKYGYTSEEIDEFKNENGFYKNFYRTKMQPSGLFN